MKRLFAFALSVSVLSASAATVDRLVARQMWPWERHFEIGYRLKKNPLKTKDKVPYLADVVPVGTANLDTILSDVAESLNITKARARLCYDAMFELIHAELAKGNKVQTPFGLMEPAISGSFDTEDAPFDPKRNKVYVKVTPPKALRDALKKVVPERLDAPELSIGTVVTATLGARAYNTVKRGEPFVVSGSGFEAGMVASLTDGKEASHPLAIESAKSTAISISTASSETKSVVHAIVPRLSGCAVRFFGGAYCVPVTV